MEILFNKLIINTITKFKFIKGVCSFVLIQKNQKIKTVIKEITPFHFVSFAFFFRLFWKVYIMWFITPLFEDGLWCVVAHYF